ncbi:hypothetical protein LCGC14_2575670 [marine sediment metagenome]|uniref:Uncharacterized protein n=1 Tax=marine sediment metagenome TaxID=412755 RepID=A0A0F9D8P8_9ZZZZ
MEEKTPLPTTQVDPEELEKFDNFKVGPSQPSEPPEKWQRINSLPVVVELGSFIVEVLSGGIKIGTDWEKAGESYPHYFMARLDAYKLCKVVKCPVRIRLKGRTVAVCAFYPKEKQVFIALPVPDGKKVTWIEHEIFDSMDMVGGDVQEVSDLGGKENG